MSTSHFADFVVGESASKTLSDLLAQVLAARDTAQVAQAAAQSANASATASLQRVISLIASIPSSAVSPWKLSVRVAATFPVDTSSAGAAYDGVSLVQDDRLLLQAQSDPVDNGVYVFNGAGSPLTRAIDMDEEREVPPGSTVYVAEGTTNAERFYTLTTPDATTPGTDALRFEDVLSISGNLAALPRPYDFGASAAGTLAANELIMQLPAVRSFRIPQNFAGSRAILGTAPSGGILIIPVAVNGTTVGNITFADGQNVGNFQPVTPDTDIDLVAGDIVSFTAPTNVFSAASLAVSFYGQVEE